jgi:glycosyltransferase involved in cell wall biosynthesis
LPTSYEAFPLAVLEAAASGLSVLATNVNGTEEFIRDGVNGFFILRDANDIAAKLLRVVDDATLRQALGASARVSTEQYSWDIVAQKTLALYKEIL